MSNPGGPHDLEGLARQIAKLDALEPIFVALAAFEKDYCWHLTSFQNDCIRTACHNLAMAFQSLCHGNTPEEEG